MKRLSAVGLAFAGLVLAPHGPARAQEEPREPPSFPRGVELVRVDVVVTDKSGNPVTGLGQDEFTLLDEGQPQAIETFDAVNFPLPSATGKPAPRPRVTSNVAPPGEAPERAGRTFVVVFDNMHLSPLNAQRAKAAVAAFFEKGGREGDRVTLIATGGGAWWSTRLDAGRADLLAILKGLEGRRVPESAKDRMTDYEAMRVFEYQDAQVGRRVQRRFETYGTTSRQESALARDRREGFQPGVIDPYVERKASETYMQVKNRGRITLGALERALKPLEATRDRKTVVLVSEGFIYDTAQEGFKRVTEAARRANAAVYFVDTRGLVMPSIYSAEFGAPIDEREVGAVLADASQDAEGAEFLSIETGGFAVRNSNDLVAGMDRIAREARSYYVLGFNPAGIPRDGRFRKIVVRVSRKGLSVRARKGYYAPGESTAASVAPKREDKGDPAMQEALDSSGFLNAIPVRLTTYVLQETLLGKARALVVADVDVTKVDFREGPDTPGQLTAGLDMLLVVAHRESDDFSRYDQKIDLARKPGPVPPGPNYYRIVRDFDLPPGGHQAKLVLRDVATGKMASVAHDFEVPPLDDWRVSTPILTDAIQRPEGKDIFMPVLLTRREFTEGQPLYCRFDVYGAKKDKDGMPRVRAGHVLRKADGTVRSRSEPTPVLPTSLGAISRLMQIPLDVEPGDYELVLTVSDELTGKRRELLEPFRVTPAGQPSAP
jgi:VWFA-related protein